MPVAVKKQRDISSLRDPLVLGKILWPTLDLYGKQVEMLRSAYRDKETYVPGSNKGGKDLGAAVVVLTFGIINYPAKVVTTSVNDKQLDSLWGEIDRLIRTAKYPLLAENGGPFVYTHRRLVRVVKGTPNKDCYITSMVAPATQEVQGKGLSGHHAPNTLAVIDEAIAVREWAYDAMREWAAHMLMLSNTNPGRNFFWRGCKAGDMAREEGGGYYRKVIRIKAEDSPNVKFGLRELELGRKPSGRTICAGPLSWQEYIDRRKTWDKVKQRIGLDAEFPEGKEHMLFPQDWLDGANKRARELGFPSTRKRGRNDEVWMGCDPAEGGDRSTWVVIDKLGILEIVSIQTPNTAAIIGETKALIKKWGIPSDHIGFDRGGGGKQHADALREDGYDVNTVDFGGSCTITEGGDRDDARENRGAFAMLRDQMWWRLRELIDPDLCAERGEAIFAIPECYDRLRGELSPVPLTYDRRGRFRLLPKTKRRLAESAVFDDDDKHVVGEDGDTLIGLIGHSPDEADALAIACHMREQESLSNEPEAW